MNLHVVKVRPGLRTNLAFGRLTMLQRDFYYGLLAVAQEEGWFEANAALLRALLYGPCLGKVSERELSDGLRKLQEVGLIKLWTGRNGRPYGQVLKYRQDLRSALELPGEAHPPDDELPGLAAADPPDFKQKGEGEGEGEGERPPPPAKKESPEKWKERMRREWPHTDLDMQLKLASKHQRDRGKRLEREWFEEQWLPKCGTEIEAPGDRRQATGEREAAPEGWQQWVTARWPACVYARGGTEEATPWAKLPEDLRAQIRKEMQPNK